MKIRQNAVDNFIASIDLTEDKKIHIDNAIRDSYLYGWNMLTISEIIDGIEKLYREEE